MKTIFINDLENAIREDLEKINTDTINIYTSYEVIKYSKEEYLKNKIGYCKDLLLSIKINQLECSVCYDRDHIDFYFINNENEYIYNNNNSCYMVIEEEKTEEEKIESLKNSGYKLATIKDCIEIKPSTEFKYGMILEEEEVYKKSILIKGNNIYIIFYSDTFNQYFEIEVNKKDIIYLHYIDSGIDNYIENKR